MKIEKTIKKVLRENTTEKFMEMIDEFGIVKVSQYVGFYELKKRLGYKPQFSEKIIDEIVSHLEKNPMGGVNLNEIGESFLYQQLSENEEEQIEYLSDEGVVVVSYKFVSDDYGWDQLDEYSIPYVMLPDSILEHIIRMIIDNKI